MCKLKRFLKKVKAAANKVLDWLCLRCPECGGKLVEEFYDVGLGKMIYRCEKCGEEWI